MNDWVGYQCRNKVEEAEKVRKVEGWICMSLDSKIMTNRWNNGIHYCTRVGKL